MPSGSRRQLLAGTGLGLVMLVAHGTPLAAPGGKTPLRFGVLPIGGPKESVEDWRPVLLDMARHVGREVEGLAVSSYDGMQHLMEQRRVDVAFMSGTLAVKGVTQFDMQVVAQLARRDGSSGYRSVLIVQDKGPIATVQDLLNVPGKWRFARGEDLSVSGYLVPELQFFAEKRIHSDAYFRSVKINNHQNNALAVANDETDVATNNTADLEKFQERFPTEFTKLRVIWSSSEIPHGAILARTDLPAGVTTRLRQFLLSYGRRPGAEEERANLRRVHDLAGFVPANNSLLRPMVDLEYRLAVRRAENAQWVSDAAKNSRLAKLREDYEKNLRKLTTP